LSLTLKEHEEVVRAHAPHRKEDGGKSYEWKSVHADVEMSVLEVFYFLVLALNRVYLFLGVTLAEYLDQLVIMVVSGKRIIFQGIAIACVSILRREHIIAKGALLRK
jgi:hypothetical protein